MTNKITVIGTRGIPNVFGGVETHCQHLYPEIHKQFNSDICVVARSPYVDYKTSSYQGIKTQEKKKKKKIHRTQKKIYTQQLNYKLK